MKNIRYLFIVNMLCLQKLIASEEASSHNNYEHIVQGMNGPAVSDWGVDEDIHFFLAAAENRRKLTLSRSDQIDEERLIGQEDQFLEGYIQALIDANYYEYDVIVLVKDRKVYLYRLPNNSRIRNSIIAFVSDLPDIEGVEEGKLTPDVAQAIDERYGKIPRIKGVWFPEPSVLFSPLIANPHDPLYSIGYRWNDRVLAKDIISISFGDTFPIFRWFDVGSLHGDLQIDISAGVWGVFDLSPHNAPEGQWAELTTTDYMLAIPISYAFDKWAFRFRVYHISSHLGDEFMVNNPNVERLNPSYEVIEIFSSYQATDGIRLYFGPGFVVHSDSTYPLKPVYLEYGTEIRMMGWKYHYHRLYGSPFFALDVQNWQEMNFAFSVTAQLGYEWSKLQGAGRKVRIFGEYHNGFSEGQFFKERTAYWTIRLAYGF